MARNEATHRARLRERRTRLFGDAPRTMTRALLWDVEAPEYDEARAFMTVRHAMETALRCEEKAHAFFVEALRHVEEPQIRALLAELRDEEVDHQRMIRGELDRLAGQPPIDDEDFTDEPTSQ